MCNVLLNPIDWLYEIELQIDHVRTGTSHIRCFMPHKSVVDK